MTASIVTASLVTASLVTQPIGVAHYLVVGAVLFIAGILCMATKRNLLGVLMGVERAGPHRALPGPRAGGARYG